MAAGRGISPCLVLRTFGGLGGDGVVFGAACGGGVAIGWLAPDSIDVELAGAIERSAPGLVVTGSRYLATLSRFF